MDTSSAPKNFVIIGGGTAGWIAASGLARILLRQGKPNRSVTLIESSDIGTIGVGEATIPSVFDMIKFLNIDEADFMRHTQATYKLGIKFSDWRDLGHSFWHPFGTVGPTIENHSLFEHLFRERIHGRDGGELQDLSICSQMCLSNKFAKPSPHQNSSLNGLGHALHFDAGLVGQYLSEFAQGIGVKRIIGHVGEAHQDEGGNITKLSLKDGREITGDFFIDCSGFSGVLIDKTLKSEYEDWSHWLPLDRAVAVPCEMTQPITPYTTATARDSGWTWRIPLQSRTGNGYVYAGAFCDKEKAEQTLMSVLDAKALDTPRHLSFRAGRRKANWVKNCLALGLSSGFLEPLESTNIHFMFANLFRFFDHFPSDKNPQLLRDSFNARSIREIEETRDFIILHYCLSQRRDSAFWCHVTNMSLPDSLAARIELFKNHGRLIADFYDLFRPGSWVSIYDGMGVRPLGYNPLIDTVPIEFSQQTLKNVALQIKKDTSSSLSHDAYLKTIGL